MNTGDVCELEEEDVLKKAQQHLQALSSCFAQLTHKAQTIFQNNAKLEAELVHLRREACEGKAQLKVLKEKLDTLSIPQPPPEADPLSSDPKTSEVVVTGIQNQLPEFIQAEEVSLWTGSI
ncbi:hypothetical protein HAZT_HAZT009615 [Hyalella azteca]|uniref:Uncharacterized protein n=1 Tax=Hyalella azteca TaxID=294128 RepID=A0A6A0H9H0_HYAAZ|nr:hypothetical protein HAZT_HAZT009615 [Hyalella azteca]